ncbi:B3/B4 domain-containing protein [Trinickia fusca]|uniref:B3/B4 tRNA-binding domain-containing protein n=1 Tax=Trinickia fusca TaxID=2419777 RepID=A0A494XV85_9BURK|nr:phenylalanine--tRNA ligase beta subunit-related protein [Trinickia fusca]RKP52856.1 hypothetical protein D7S89_03795 [Trinickia fusca]
MTLRYAPSVLHAFPELVSRAWRVDGITCPASADTNGFVDRLTALAAERLASSSEGELPEIRSWRHAFAKMGLKPTQYRCASEALLRRFRKEGALPHIHPLVDLCNAVSLAFAIPLAVFDLRQVAGALTVRHADGSETYRTFSGEIEHPEPHEVIFADEAGEAHARRWTNRQSGASAVRTETASVLIVAEAMHETAQSDLARLDTTLRAGLAAAWPARWVHAIG